MLLSFVFSFRNEEENIPELVQRVANVSGAIDDLSYEMIFVNDASTDNSVALLKNLQESYPITILNMSRRFGVTPCILAGFAQAKGDAVVYMDSDLQDPPELVEKLVERFRAGAEVVHTTRTYREGEGKFKLWATRKAYHLINFFSDIPLPENTGDFKLLSSKVIQEILNLKEYDPYMRGLSVWVGHRQEFVFYRRETRHAGKTKFPLLSQNPIQEFIRGLTAYSSAPLYISFVLGLLTSIFSVLLIMWAVITKLMGISAPGASGVLIAVAFFSGIVLMTNGVIGIYVARIYYDVKGRPRYIVDSIIEPSKKQK
ncbi:MAG: glycosyltransferase family 2 protein [Pseudomonadota bacterium]|nr:glycosyltransferase family 2 protein [Pseudomonadota bacterium]